MNRENIINKEQDDRKKARCLKTQIVCVLCVAFINTSITMIQRLGWHVIDLLCWTQSAD